MLYIAKKNSHFYTKICSSKSPHRYLDREMKKSKFYLLCLVIMGFAVSCYYFISPCTRVINNLLIALSSQLYKKNQMSKPEHWITVFVHGSFGSVLSFLSINQVLNDDLKGSLYRKINKKIRKDTIFYQDQTMLDKGFRPIIPTFDYTSASSNKAAFPIIKAYETILDKTRNKQEKNHFYTFGWSGLVSQYRRRYEAVRLYNHLVEESEKFERQGITPKIRLIAHSHGGNVCLNLAAIEKILHKKNINQEHIFSENQDEQESIQEMFKIISQFPNKEAALQKKGQKRYNYVPSTKYIFIDELIMLGTPIQLETASFVLSDIFKKIYNIYSEEDVIQKIDILSTKGYTVNQRISPEILNLSKYKNNIKQIKIMYGRIFDTKQSDTAAVEPNTTPEEEPKSFWGKIFSLGSSLSKKNEDPTHKELWFIAWKDKECPNDFCLAPLPTVIFAPVLSQLVDKFPSYHDSDINIISKKNKILLQLLKHDEKIIRANEKIPLHMIQTIKKNLEKWKPNDLSGASEFNALSEYLASEQ